MTLEFRNYRSTQQHTAVQVTPENIREIRDELQKIPAIDNMRLVEFGNRMMLDFGRGGWNKKIQTGDWINDDFQVVEKLDLWEDLTPIAGPAEPEPHGVYRVIYHRRTTEKTDVVLDIDQILKENPDFLNDLYAENRSTPEEEPLEELLEYQILDIVAKLNIDVTSKTEITDDELVEASVSKLDPFSR